MEILSLHRQIEELHEEVKTLKTQGLLKDEQPNQRINRCIDELTVIRKEMAKITELLLKLSTERGEDDRNH